MSLENYQELIKNLEQQKLEHEVFERVVNNLKHYWKFKTDTPPPTKLLFSIPPTKLLFSILGEELSQKIIREMEDK